VLTAADGDMLVAYDDDSLPDDVEKSLLSFHPKSGPMLMDKEEIQTMRQRTVERLAVTIE
jgi:hypothetical protein